ncbi:MAG: hypothetical protein HYZ83_00110 [Candidatus Omnitrophica bacterium]|nr:hypothetical protein [Candidatus Omnitrophota bacterium]
MESFKFFTRLNLHELTGLKAKNLGELLALIRTVPGSVIYHHTHHYLQRHQLLSPEPPNDFAYWVTEVLQEQTLGEKLVSINTSDFNSIRELREKIASVIEAYLQEAKEEPRAAHAGEEFHFIKSVSFIFPTPYAAHNLAEFVSVLEKVTVHSIYFHMFEAKLRLEKGKNDFSVWMETVLGEKELAKKIARLDPYTYTMESLRQRIIQLAKIQMTRGESAVTSLKEQPKFENGKLEAGS